MPQSDFYDRVAGQAVNHMKIAPGYVCQLIGEMYRNKVDMDYAHEFLTASTGEGLDTDERADLTALLATVDGTDRLQEIWDVFYMSDAAAPGYNTGPDLVTRLGVS